MIYINAVMSSGQRGYRCGYGYHGRERERLTSARVFHTLVSNKPYTT